MMGRKQFTYLDIRIIKKLFIEFIQCLFFEKN